MFSPQQPLEFITSLSRWVQGKINTIEIVAVVIIIIVLALNAFLQQSILSILPIILLPLGCCYFLLAYSPEFTGDRDRVNEFLYKISNYASSVFSIGFLFKIMHWPGTSLALMSAGIILLITFIALLFVRKRESFHRYFDNQMIMRIAIAGVFALLLWLLPAEELSGLGI